LFFLRNKINAVRDAKSLKLQGLSAPEAPISRLRRSGAPFYPALLFSIFPGKHFRPAISQTGVSKRRALLTFPELFFDCALAFYLQKAGKKLYTIRNWEKSDSIDVSKKSKARIFLRRGAKNAGRVENCQSRGFSSAWPYAAALKRKEQRHG